MNHHDCQTPPIGPAWRPQEGEAWACPECGDIWELRWRQEPGDAGVFEWHRVGQPTED